MKTIAVIAYAVSDKYGSEYAVGWNYVKEMSKYGEFLFTVYYGSCRGGTMGAIETLPDLPNVTWKCIELPQTISNKLYWLIRRKIYYALGFYFQFRKWHDLVYKQIKKDNESVCYDIVHYLNPIGIKEPGFLWKLKIPYIWGPVQGVENWPKCLFPVLTTKGKVEAYVRLISQNINIRYSTRLKKAINKCSLIIGATPNTCQQIKDLWNKESIYLPENGLLMMEREDPIIYEDGQHLELIWAGELSSRKALIILLKALTQLDDAVNMVHLNVLGDGDQYDILRKYVIDNNLDKVVTFYGKVSREKVQEIFNKSHLHVITSLSEATTTVIWEAKAKAIPTLTLDHCGMSGVVNSECGIKIPINNLKQVVNDIAYNIRNIVSNPYIVTELSKGVIKENKRFMWNVRYDFFCQAYNEVLGNNVKDVENENSSC